MRPALLVHRGDERDLHDEGAPRLHRRAGPARDHRPRQRSRSTRGPRARFGYSAETDRRIARCISFLRETPEDNGYARPIEGRHRPLRPRAQRGHRGDRPRRRAAARAPRALLPRRPRAAAHRPEAARDHAARGAELHRRREPRSAGARWSFRIGFDPYEGTTLHQVTYDDHGRERSVLHRASVTEMVVPVRRPGAAARLEERVRRGRVGARAHDAVADARLRLPRRDPLLRRDARERDRRAVHDRERDLPPRGGLRDPLEARRPVQRHERGAPQPSARREHRSRPSATTSTRSAGTCTSTGTSSSR